MIDFIKIGKLGKAMGVSGKLLIHVDDRFYEYLEREQVIFTDVKGSKVPFFMEHLDLEDEVVKFDDVHNPEDAALISGQDIYADASRLGSVTESGQDPHMLTGFTAYDGAQCIGKIIDILEYPQQVMLSIDYEGTEVLIPFVEDFINHADPEDKHLYLDLPEGLLDL